MSPILGILASSRRSAANSYESIATVSVGSGGQNVVSFTSIPSTYKHLQIRYICNTNIATNPAMTFNSDSGSNYSWHYISGNGASAGASGAANQSYLLCGVPPTSTYFQAAVIDILDYADTNKNKTTRWFMGNDQNGSGEVALFSGLWRSTSAINTISITPQSTRLFNQYSQFALYGIKG
jgi:hypothetical protein